MEIERIAEKKGRIEIWAYDWDLSVKPAGKINRKFLGYEQPVKPDAATQQSRGHLLVVRSDTGQYRSVQ